MSKYLITDGINYLKEYKQGDYYLVDKNDATSWNTYKQALNAMNNGVRKDHRDMFYVEKSGEAGAPPKTLKKLIEADTSDFNRWLSSIGNFKQFVNTIELIKSSLCTELGEVNKEMCDILHYIEFGKLNACQGWAATEMMKNSRRQRRKIKDALYIIDEIEKGRRNGIPEDKSAQTAIFNMNNRKYTPRKLNFLFEGPVCARC